MKKSLAYVFARLDFRPRKKLKEEMGLPLFVIEQVFSLYEAKGWGLQSKTVGAARYMSKT
jgi:hypothetical protein